MKKIIICFLLLASTGIFAQALKVDKDHKGVIDLPTGYQIFPENRIGNGLYGANNKLLYQLPDRTIVAAFDYADHLLLINKNQQDQKEITYQNPNAKEFQFIAPTYFQFALEGDKHLVRYQEQESKLEKIDIPYLSAAGFVHNQKDTLAFYRVVSYDPENYDEGKEYSTFVFRVSLLKDNSNVIIKIPKSFESKSSRVSLQWLDNKNLIFSLREGKQNIPIP